MKTRGSPWDSGFDEVWPPSSLDSNRNDNFLCGVSERDVNRSPHSKMQPNDHLHLGGVDQPSQGGPKAENYKLQHYNITTLYEKEQICKVSVRCHSLRIFCNSFCKLQKTGVNTARTLYVCLCVCLLTCLPDYLPAWLPACLHDCLLVCVGLSIPLPKQTVMYVFLAVMPFSTIFQARGLTDRQTSWKAGRNAGRQKGRQEDKQEDREQKGRQKGWQKGWQKERQIYCKERQMSRHINMYVCTYIVLLLGMPTCTFTNGLTWLSHYRTNNWMSRHCKQQLWEKDNQPHL